MHHDDHEHRPAPMPGRHLPMVSSRRTFLRMSVMGFAGVALAGCTTDGAPDDAGTTANDATGGGTGVPTDSGEDAVLAETTTLTVADFAALPTCVLLPELTAGPFPLAQQLVRRDVTEGYPGHPLRLGLRVVDDRCEPVPGAAVEIWHTDATGDYSAFADGGGGKDEADGTTFLRGTQVADGDGIVEFQTIYPGWYPGRCVHIHLRVHVDDRTVLATQLVFPDEYTAEVFTAGPYAEFGPPDTTVGQDFISANAASEGTYVSVAAGAETVNGVGTLGLLNLGIDPEV